MNLNNIKMKNIIKERKKVATLAMSSNYVHFQVLSNLIASIRRTPALQILRNI